MTDPRTKNLILFKPGQSGNPAGRYSFIPAYLRGIKGLTKTEMTYLVSKFFRMTEGELEAVAENPNSPAIDKAIVSVLQKIIKQGDVLRFTFLLERTIGRPIEIPESEEEKEAREKLAKMSIEELMQLVKSDIPEDVEGV